MATLLFHRPARTYPEPPARGEMVLVAPPTEPEPQGKLAIVMQAVLPLVMSMGSLAFVFLYPSGLLLRIIFIGVALLGGVGSILTAVTQSRSHKRARKRDRVRYTEYLRDREQRLTGMAELQRAFEERFHPRPADLASVVVSRTCLWERRASDRDFLHTRLGVGSVPLLTAAKLDVDDNPMVQHDAQLLARAQDIVDRFTDLANAPVTVPLAAMGSIAVIGNRGRGRALVRAMLAQMTVSHAPDDLSIAVYLPSEARQEWEWLKWLPHVRNPNSQTLAGAPPECLLSDDVGMFARLLGGQLRPRIDQSRRTRGRDEAPSAFNHQVVVIDGYTPRAPIAQLALLNEALPLAHGCAATFICLVDELGDEPSHVSARIEIDDEAHLELTEASADGRRIRAVTADQLDVANAEAIARAMAPLRLQERRSQREFSENVRLLDLLGLESAANTDPHRTWRPRSRNELMQVPLGIRADGDSVFLDLKEAAEGGMGPHGLVVGATGSGKSELLRTLVTGLAVNHPPDILSFVFVDFKGGAAFADLAELPHVAGMITNLSTDLSRVDRMYSALIGEQDRRQRLLREAGNVDGIKEYQIRRASDPTMTPMPYLMIVVDEFGELLANRPDFLDLFVGIGRVGRSLGMHLLFATQRLEEGRIRGLEGHLRYRICLRTFSPQESQTVLGTPDAYHLPSFPGAGYFKVDTTTYMRFKTALITSPFRPGAQMSTSRPSVQPFTGIQGSSAAFVDNSGGSAGPGDSGETTTEMEVAISRLVDLGKALSPPVHQVWLPPLDPIVTLDQTLALARQRHALPHADDRRPFGLLRVPLGIVDKPQAQDQDAMVVDFAGSAGHVAIVGAPQSGKSMFLRALMASFMLTHTPEDVQFYCIDLGGGTLHSLENAPHVGAVCGKLEREKVRRVVREMQSIIEERELLFRKHAIDSISTFRRMRLDGTLPATALGDVFLLVDNWGQLRVEFDELDNDIGNLLVTGLGYGVHVVLTAGRWNDIRANYRDNIATRLELRLNDPLESELGRNFSMALPTNVAGRGIMAGGLQFQIAVPRMDGQQETSRLNQAVERLVANVLERWQGSNPAPQTKMLPSVIRPAELPVPRRDGPRGVPVGIEEFRLEPVYLDLFGSESHFLLLGDSEAGKTSVIRLWMHQLMARHTPDEVQFVLVDYRRGLLDSAEGPYIRQYAATANLAKDAVEDLRMTLVGRLPPPDVTRDALINRSWWSGPECVVFVDDYDLVASPMGNPLAPLVDFLAQGRDVGFHLVLARRVGGSARSAFETVFQRIKELSSPGLIMSGDPTEGPLIGTQRAAALPVGRGYLVRRQQRTALVQIAHMPPR